MKTVTSVISAVLGAFFAVHAVGMVAWVFGIIQWPELPRPVVFAATFYVAITGLRHALSTPR